MITFEPETPWTVGQSVTLHDDGDGLTSVKVVESIEHSKNETQYHLVDERVWKLRQAGVRPWVELG